MYAFQEPPLCQAVEEQAAERSVAQRDIPFVATPPGGRAVPPGARCAPRTSLLPDVPTRHPAAIDRDANRTATLDGHTHGEGRAEATEDQGARRLAGAVRSRRAKSPHLEAVRAMGVEHDGGPAAALADERAEAGG